MAVSSRSKATDAYRRLRGMIESGELKTGQPLTEARAASLLGVGRSPVRESILRLKAEGLLDQKAARCIPTVRYAEDMSHQQILHLTTVNAYLAAAAAAEAARYMSGVHINQLRELAKVADELTAQENHSPQERTQASYAFHDYLIAHCGNPLIVQTLSARHLQRAPTRTQVLEDRRRAIYFAGGGTAPSKVDLVEAIAAHDSDRASNVMMAHLQRDINVWRKLAMESGSSHDDAGGIS